MKKIAIVGSSGGNLYSQGGNNPQKLLGEVLTQAKAADFEVAFVEFVAATTSLDNIKEDSIVSLYTLDSNGELILYEQGELSAINETVKELDANLAEQIVAQEIEGLVVISADPKSNNQASAEAAKNAQIPVAGSGGSAMGVYEQMGCNVVSSTGTTGTTDRTRAVAYISALAKAHDHKYRAVLTSSASASAESTTVWQRINVRGIMFAALPAFIAMAIMIALGQIGSLNSWIVSVTGNESASFSAIGSTIIGLLPVILAAIAAKQVSGFDEVGVVAGIIAGALSTNGGVIGGIITGILAGVIVYYVATWALKNRVPGTTTNLLSGALGGLLAGFVGMFLISPIAAFLGNGIRNLIDQILAYNSILAGLVAGALIWFAIMGGVYHAAILPIVLIEMEAAGFSFLGAVDLVCLVCVSAGITLGNVILPREKSGRTAALPGFLVNIFFGTFVEAAYPYMFGDKKVLGGAIFAGAVGGALVGLFNVKSTAYVPTFVAPGLTNEKPIQLVIAMLAAAVVAMLITIWANKTAKSKEISAE
ncbi:MAG TPA: PTS sugar transporter [Clostridiaceae bacterium]|nr:PTS sugar transporter [Clostridiaceae bacterium]